MEELLSKRCHLFGIAAATPPTGRGAGRDEQWWRHLLRHFLVPPLIKPIDHIYRKLSLTTPMRLC
jgi:hypothetical protein